MPISQQEKQFVAYVIDLMQLIGPVNARRMFGGHGIFLDGLMFALVADGVLYLKADDATAAAFTDLGLEAFSYYKQGKAFKLSYYQAPEEALEDAEELRAWANTAYGVALKAAAEKRK